ncbi:MAG: histidinol dehydrogenase [Bacteroidales bacterium]
MKIINNPVRSDWNSLCQRPFSSDSTIGEAVRTILDDVKANGDSAVLKYTSKFDGAQLTDLTVSEREIDDATASVSPDLKEAINQAYSNIRKFHETQVEKAPETEVIPGVYCWRSSSAIEKIGLYIPGGSAPLFSTVLMLAIPAVIAGCRDITLCTPPSPDGKINDAILYCAAKSGITRIFKAGGAQAIAAMAYGTETIEPVYKIFGPGNRYVTKAKEIVRQEGVEIDMPAGPSEVLVIADSGARPDYVAADLLSQAEHGSDSQVILLSDSQLLIDLTLAEIQAQVEKIPRKDIANKALSGSLAIKFDSPDTCMEFSNLYAPEHLIINCDKPRLLASKVKNAGSVFLGAFSCESAGDYASGTNHTLPTSSFARVSGGVSVDSFVKKITFQELTRDGLSRLSLSICTMAEAESLQAHSNAVKIRLNSTGND